MCVLQLQLNWLTFFLEYWVAVYYIRVWRWFVSAFIVVFNLNYRKRRKPFRLDYSRQGIHLNGKWSFCATTDDNSRSPHRTNTLPSRVNLSHSVNYKFNFNVSGNGEGFPFCICKRSYFCELITRHFVAIYEYVRTFLNSTEMISTLSQL